MKLKGFSLLECMIGIFLLVLFVFMTNAYMMTFMKTNLSIKNISTATALGQSKLEELRLKPYNLLTSGVDTIQSKYIRSWKVTDKGSLKEIIVTVTWQNHKIETTTLIAK